MEIIYLDNYPGGNPSRGVIIFDAAKFERRSFRRSGDTARAKLRIYYASNSVLAAKNPFFS